MSLKVKSILFGGLAILVLLFVLVMLLQDPQENVNKIENITNSSTSTTQTASTLQLINKDTNLIESVTVKNTVDEYVITKLDSETWGIEELADFNLVTNFASMLRTVSSFSAVEIVEEDVEDLSIFGFDEPNIIIDVVFSDSKTYEIKVGDISNQTNTAYVIIDNGNTVYRFFPSTFSDFLNSMKSFISTNVIGALPTYDYGTVDPEFTYMKLEREDLDEPWVFEKYQAITDIILTIPTYLQFSSPVECDVNADKFPIYFENYFGLAASYIEAYNPTVDELKSYGFDKPYAKLTTVYGAGEMEYTIVVGDKIATSGFDSHYVMHEGTDLVYVVDSSSLPFLKVTTADIISSILVLESLYEYSEIDVTVNGSTTNLEIWEEDGIIAQADDGSYVYEDGVLFVNVNGNEIDPELYKQYIQVLFLTSASDVTEKRPTGNPDVSIKYTYNTGEIETVEVYEQSDRTTILVLNGKDYFVGRSGYIESVQKETFELNNIAN